MKIKIKETDEIKEYPFECVFDLTEELEKNYPKEDDIITIPDYDTYFNLKVLQSVMIEKCDSSQLKRDSLQGV